MRKFEDAEATQPTLAAEGHRFLSAMYLHEAEAQKLGLVADALVEHRRRLIRPLAEQLKKWCAAVAPTLLPSEPLTTAVRYYQRHHEALFRFIDDANVPIDNSATEREFQNVAKLRLNVLFAGSTEGAHRACVLLGIVAAAGSGMQRCWKKWAERATSQAPDFIVGYLAEFSVSRFESLIPRSRAR